MADQPKKVKVYIAVKEFELDGVHYKEGDEVTLPGYKRDAVFDAARSLKGSPAQGLTFSKEGPVIDKATQDRNLFRFTLPVKEA